MSRTFSKICVFCASSTGSNPAFAAAAYATGQMLAKRNIGVVYGGAKVGLMGKVADGALAAGGEVTGVLPHFMGDKELAHEGLTELILVDSMHERKTVMHNLSDGVIALPGGFGTLEELFEILTWAQLGLHEQPTGVLNVAGYYDSLLSLVTGMESTGLLRTVNRQMLLHSESIEGLLETMGQYAAPPNVGKWIKGVEQV